MIGQFNKEVKF